MADSAELKTRIEDLVSEIAFLPTKDEARRMGYPHMADLAELKMKTLRILIEERDRG